MAYAEPAYVRCNENTDNTEGRFSCVMEEHRGTVLLCH